jgi:hypothetical protein
LLRLRFWGVGLLAVAGSGTALSLFSASPELAISALGPFDVLACGVVATVALFVAVAPFVRPAARFLRAG